LVALAGWVAAKAKASRLQIGTRGVIIECVKLVVSNSLKGAQKGVIDMLARSLKDGGEHLFLVPDAFSMHAEKTVLSELGVFSSFNIEVSTFTRLAQKLLSNSGKRCLTPEGSVMLLQRVIDKHADKLVYFKRSCRAEGFAHEFYAALAALRNGGVTPQEIRAKLKELPPRQRAKMTDMAFIFEKYLEELSESYFDASTRLEALASYFEKSEHFPKHVYIANFCTFKAPELKIIEALNKAALSLTVGAVTGFSNPNSRIYPAETYYKLKALSKNTREFRAAYELPAPFSAISEWLYSYEPPKALFCGGAVSLFKSPTVYDEVENIAVSINKLVEQNGHRFKDIAIAVPDVAEYAPYIKSAFKRHRIPFFIDQKERMHEQAKPRLMLSALAAAADFSADAVLDFVKNPLFGFSPFEFENYVVKRGINYSRFLSPFELPKNDERDGEQDDSAESGERPSEHILAEQARKRLCELLLDFSSAKTAGDFVKCLKRLDEKCESAWREYIAKLSAESPFYQKCLEQVDKKTAMIFDEIEAVFGHTEISAREFINLLAAMFSAQKIALLPLYIDCVSVGGLESFYDCEILFAAGAVEDKFPAQTSGGAILSERDEELLKKCGIEVFDGARDKNLAALYGVCRLLSSPKQRLYVCYPEHDGAPTRPASVFIQLTDLFFEDEEKTTPIKIADTAEEDFSLHYSNAKDRAAQFAYRLGSLDNCFLGALNASGGTDKMFMQPYDAAYSLLPKEKRGFIDNLFRFPQKIPRELFIDFSHASVSRLECFYTCPYKHFLKYGLKISPRERADILPYQTGQIIHAVLKRFFARYDFFLQNFKNADKKQSGFFDLTDQIFDAVINSERFKYLKESESAKKALARLKRECAKMLAELFDIMKNSDFSPYLLEAGFFADGAKGDRREKDDGVKLICPKIQTDAGEVCLHGVIDRVDKWRDYISVVDYKTGNAELKLKHIYSGTKLQLYIYLYVAAKSTGLKPAAAYYLPISAAYRKEDKKNRYSYIGHVNKDLEVLRALENSFPDENGVLPAKLDKHGEATGASVLADEDFKLLCQTAMDAAAHGIEEILAGNIEPRPVEEGCGHCDYKEICAFTGQNERKIPAIKIEELKELKSSGKISEGNRPPH
jgi:ATP-dependent helicase/nuclease subunit B